MTRIDFINQLYSENGGQGDLKRAQRRKARFMNTTMIVTLLGAAASDALESGQVVSGVGGQYNFVAMAHALPDARLIMMLRATHDNKAGLKSSIVWSYGNITIPRHLRDIYLNEYGIADLRGRVGATDGRGDHERCQARRSGLGTDHHRCRRRHCQSHGRGRRHRPTQPGTPRCWPRASHHWSSSSAA